MPAAIDAVSMFRSSPKIGVIAEIKRASPSRGKLSDIPEPQELGIVYESAGAAAISVLTEHREFLGSLDDLAKVKANVAIPVLRKDFIANEYQILEARAAGADLVLLIVAGLETTRLSELYRFILELGMTPLVETHSQEEVEIASELGAELVGINARDLSTFKTDRELFSRLAASLPDNCLKVAESAVRGVSDVENYAKQGADLVLVGEALVTGDARRLVSDFSRVPRA